MDTQNKISVDIFAMTGEIVFLFLVFFSLLGILNYFRIISLEKSFPALAILPHEKNIISSQENIMQTVPTLKPVHQDIPVATNTLLAFIQSVVQTPYLPSSLTLQEVKNHATAAATVTFSDSWAQKGYILGAEITFFKVSSAIQQLTVIASLPSSSIPLNLQPSETTTYNLLHGIFLSVPQEKTFHCIPKGSLTICESFQELHNEKQGYGITVASSPPSVQAFSCKIFKINAYFNSTQSCFAF